MDVHFVGHRDRYRRRSPSPRGYRGGGGRDSYRDSYRRRSPPAPYYNRPRRTPPRSGTTLFVAGLNFVTTERVGPLPAAHIGNVLPMCG